MYTPSALFAPDRLASLYERKLLDSPKIPALDRVTELVAHVLGAPVALLTLVDDHRQFFLSHFGLTGPIAEARQTPITHSFCQYVVVKGEPFIVNDARVHPLVRDNLATTELKVNAYLGVPLTTPDAKIIGALSAIDFKPRRWTPEDVELLCVLAAYVITELELRAKKSELKEEIKTSQRDDAERLTAARLTVHDLRSPLTGLLLSLEMLPDMGTLSKDQADLISTCIHTGGALRRLVDDLLEIHVLERGRAVPLQRTSASPLGLAEQAIEQIYPLAAHKRVELTLVKPDALPLIEVDAAKFVRVLVNLLCNAIKFTPVEGRVELSISRIGEGKAAAVVFNVKDTGLGIRTSDARRIFREGVKVNAFATTGESAGLGLSYCKRVMAAHGGAIWLRSVPGKGSTFSVRVPCRSPTARKSPPPQEG